MSNEAKARAILEYIATVFGISLVNVDTTEIIEEIVFMMETD